MGFMESMLSVFRTFGIDIYLKHYCTIQISLIFFILPSMVCVTWKAHSCSILRLVFPFLLVDEPLSK
jgi:hypothetical protein